jgi:hypothetical protein
MLIKKEEDCQGAAPASNSQFNSWRAFIAGKRGAWRRDESSL